jgi:hypothetical protein
MNRRSFLLRAAGFIVAPSFIPASRLWLPPERPLVVVPEEYVTLEWFSTGLDNATTLKVKKEDFYRWLGIQPLQPQVGWVCYDRLDSSATR